MFGGGDGGGGNGGGGVCGGSGCGEVVVYVVVVVCGNYFEAQKAKAKTKTNKQSSCRITEKKRIEK